MRDTIDMAKEAGLFTHREVQAELKAFEELVRADERERIEQAWDKLYGWWENDTEENA
jgi:hypothetical protein